MQNSHYHEWITRNVTCPISFTDSTSIEETIERITKSAGEQIKYFNNVFQNGNMYVCRSKCENYRDETHQELEFEWTHSLFVIPPSTLTNFSFPLSCTQSHCI